MSTLAEPKKRIKEGFIGQRMIVLPPNIKRAITSNALIKDFYLTAIGYYPKAAYHDRERRNGSNEYILLYCIDGEGHVYLNGYEHNLKPNTFFIIPRNVAHRYKSSETNPWSIYWVHFSGPNAGLIYNRSLENNLPVVQPVPYDASRIKLYEQIYTVLEHSYHEKEMEIVNINLLHFISSLVYYKQTNPVDYDNDFVSNSIAYMKKHLSTKVEVEQLARQQGISASHYLRLFKQKTGTSPINYFNLLKIQTSCQYLYFTDRSIKEICADIGFDDPYYFSRLFSKLIGISPSKYRKTHKR
ncbi:AraC family transcriptional regulator [Mucilaginibacter sp. AK015]|uniref:AraC family transcriptional regulator n=1 Tax=Mucilaginibacter sp. AK015 TaxID=2723072 RepID=UPI001613E896|nr:AraC family transcriptional regulator [Mucilaginibacter sp. AK015]MBB5394778.1 AraC-like DNA-binding protein [Mucilaginibacter sp. AK015]